MLEHFVCLQNDETVTVIIDGVDWRSDPKIISERLMQLRLEIEDLPVRLVLSCRREYWRRISTAYHNWRDYQLLSTEIKDFTDQEFEKGKKRIEPTFKDIVFADFLDYRILKDPTVFGLLRCLAREHFLQNQGAISALDLYSIYLDEIIRRTVQRTSIEEWYCKFTLKQLFACVLETANDEYTRNNPSRIKRGYLKSQIESRTGEYFPQVVQEFICSNMLQSMDDDVWFTSDVILEYGIAMLIVEQYWDDDQKQMHPDFYTKYDLRNEWLPGQIGVMVFVVCLMAKDIRLWEIFDYPFDGRVEWINQIMLNLAPNQIYPSFLKFQLFINAEQLSRLKLAALGYEPANQLNDQIIPQIANIQSGVKDLIKAINNETGEVELLEPQRFFRQFSSGSDFIEKKAESFVKEAGFWIEQFVNKNIPLISDLSSPAETKLFLGNCITHICKSPFLPVELVGDIYIAYINECSKLKVNLQKEEKLRILISDNEASIVDLLKAWFNNYNRIKQIDPHLIDILDVEGGSGYLTLEKL